MPCAEGGDAVADRVRTSPSRAVPDPQLEEIKRGLNRATLAIESLSTSWSLAYEKSSRTTRRSSRPNHEQPEGGALELINVEHRQGNSLYRKSSRRCSTRKSEARRVRRIRAA